MLWRTATMSLDSLAFFRNGSLENRRFQPKVLWRTVHFAPRFSRELPNSAGLWRKRGGAFIPATSEPGMPRQSRPTILVSTPENRQVTVRDGWSVDVSSMSGPPIRLRPRRSPGFRSAVELRRESSQVAWCARFLPRCFRGSVREEDVPRPPARLVQGRDTDPRLPLRRVARRSADSAP